MIEYIKYLVIFVVGALSDLLTNKVVSGLSNPTGGLQGLKYFYTTLPAWQAALYAGLIFLAVYWVSDFVYNLIRPNLPANWVNQHPVQPVYVNVQ